MALDTSEISDEYIALGAAVVAIVLVNVLGNLAEVPFLTRTAVAVGAGLVALAIVSYLLTGRVFPDAADRGDGR